MKMAICMITLCLLFLIRFVNGYMLRRRQKDFAVQSIMGMEQKNIAWLFFAETSIMGIVSIVLGIFFGVFCSQFITAMLLVSYGKNYELSWTLLPQDDYGIVTDFLTEHGIGTAYDCTFHLYLPEKTNFDNRIKCDFPVVAISLSDYNMIRAMLGYETISLAENEFTTQWKSIATEEERNHFLTEHRNVITDMGELTLAEHSYYEEAIGETAYNSYTDVLYVFPDSVCEKLLPVMQNRYMITAETISYSSALELEKVFTAEYPEQTDTGKYKYRFSVLRKLGVEEQHIRKLILKQLGVWFGLPVIIAIVVSTVIISYFIQTISAEISAYIGLYALILQMGTTICILTLLLICYFISTWILFRNSIRS